MTDLLIALAATTAFCVGLIALPTDRRIDAGNRRQRRFVRRARRLAAENERRLRAMGRA